MFTPHSDPILVEKITADMSASPPAVLGMARDWFLKDQPLSLSFDELKAPIRCIASNMNRFNIEAAKRHAPSFEVVYMSQVGHFVMMEDPDIFNRLLDKIVNGLSSH
jgi:pimeloyl-ACP methyl ester carboxylesterase